MRKKTTEEFIKDAVSVHGDKYLYDKTVYNGNKTKILIKCRIHGYFEQIPNNHLRGAGCNACGYDVSSAKTQRTKSDFVMSAKSVHGDKYDYSSVQYKGANNKVTIKCKRHGEFLQQPSSHLKGRGCPKCALISNGKRLRLGYDRFTKRALALHNNKYDYSAVEYIRNNVKVNIRCPLHGIFTQTPYDHLNGCGCPTCASGCYNTRVEGTLYVLRSECGNYMKIGISNSLYSRMKKLKSATPFKFELINSMSGSGEHILNTERFLHSLFVSCGFKDFDGCTEWFYYDDSVIDAIR